MTEAKSLNSCHPSTLINHQSIKCAMIHWLCFPSNNYNLETINFIPSFLNYLPTSSFDLSSHLKRCIVVGPIPSPLNRLLSCKCYQNQIQTALFLSSFACFFDDLNSSPHSIPRFVRFSLPHTRPQIQKNLNHHPIPHTSLRWTWSPTFPSPTYFEQSFPHISFPNNAKFKTEYRLTHIIFKDELEC